MMVDSISIHLDGDQIVGSGISSLDGYPKVFGGYALDRSEKDDVKRQQTLKIKNSKALGIIGNAVVDRDARERFGVYYTPVPVVQYMVAALDRALRDNLRTEGLRDPTVTILDPATV